ncbi:MAG: 1-acyl-sn-glycerol-3-phosphate acyltransferase, partial [Burkholderiales bacterium]
GAPADDIVLAPPATVPKTSSGKIRRVAAREFYERGPSSVKPQAVWLQFLRLALASAAPQLRRTWRTARGVLFSLRAYLAFGLLFPFALVAAALCGPRITWRIGSAVCRTFLRAAGIPLVVRGADALPAGPSVLAVNHTSYLDAVVLVAVLGPRVHAFVAKREFEANPLMRLLLRGFGTIFVERFDVQKSAEHADVLVEAVRAGACLVIFPEGTLTRSSGLMAFRAGAFQVAAQAGVPVVPVALRGARSVLRDGTWYARRSPVAVTIGAGIAPDGDDWAATVRLRDRVRAQILQYCGERDLAPAARRSDATS